MASQLEKWRASSSRIGKYSFVVFTGLLFNVLILVLVSYNITFFLPTTTNLITKLETTFGRLPLSKLGGSEWSAKFEILSGIWLLTGILGLWTIPQFCSSIRLCQASSQLLQNNSERAMRLIHRWFTTQYRFLLLEIVLIALFSFKYLTTYDENVVMVQQKVPMKNLVLSIILFCFGCAFIRVVCIRVVLKFEYLLKKDD